MKLKFAFLLILLFQLGFSQVGSINLNVFNDFTKKPVSATVIISGTKTTFSGEGNIMIKDLPSGNYSFEISSAGFETSFLNDITIVPNQNLTFSVGLFQKAANIQEVIIEKKAFKTTLESPVSLRNITSEEIQKNADANRDVSKAILSFPGVGTTATFRNDLFIRGGASSENKFYIDGIEVPVINHFQAQGATGGPSNYRRFLFWCISGQ